jgi:TM2 domain-containing membrane protein YozV
METTKTKTAAGCLALLLGGVGIHKFYIGSWGWGMLYVLFSITYVPFLISLYEGIMFLTMSDSEFATRVASIKGAFDW